MARVKQPNNGQRCASRGAEPVRRAPGDGRACDGTRVTRVIRGRRRRWRRGSVVDCEQRAVLALHLVLRKRPQ
eukprot:1478943-Prymnesium_polylepis.1